MNPILAVDVGNSAIKAGLAGDPPERWRSLFRWGDVSEIRIDVDAPLHWWISSVRQAQTERLFEWIRDHRAGDQAVLMQHGDLPLRIGLAEPERVGMDRLCAAAGANARAPGLPCIIVDAGTAVTVDAVSAEGEFLGGTISLGIDGIFDQLARAAPALPRLSAPTESSLVSPLAKNTRQALHSGAVLSVAGGISGLVDRLQTLVGSNAAVFLTGGSAPMLQPFLSFNAQSAEHLVLEGVLIAARARKNPRT